MHIAPPWVTCFVFPSFPVGSVLSLCQVVGLGGVLGFPHSPCWLFYGGRVGPTFKSVV